MKIVRKSKKHQALDAKFELIIDEMVLAMRNADKEYIAMAKIPLTPHMNEVLYGFQNYCAKYLNEKA